MTIEARQTNGLPTTSAYLAIATDSHAVYYSSRDDGADDHHLRVRKRFASSTRTRAGVHFTVFAGRMFIQPRLETTSESQ